MGHSLRERLQTIKSLQAEVKARPVIMPGEEPSISEISEISGKGFNGFPSEWTSVTRLVKKRSLSLDTPFSGSPLTKTVRQALAILVPDLQPCLYADQNLSPEDFVFFDLETTGLSSGAGTLAFLAAFGRFETADFDEISGQLQYVLCFTQYLLLDYPGENDFLEALLPEFDVPFIVSYNGKCFDSQILRTRCLMNAIAPPVFRQVDLLHPARRLWKRTLASCSQAEIETSILGLDRTGDISGAFAPDIWFSFLRTGETEPLLGICDHNKKDITGLASIFTAFTRIADDPSRFSETYRLDKENLALCWRRSVLKHGGGIFEETVRRTGDSLIRVAAEYGYPKAALVLGFDCMKKGFFEEARRQLSVICCGLFPDTVKALALRSLAIDAERHLKDVRKALSYVESGLALEGIGNTLRADFEHRRERLSGFPK
jgi:uncharacterized protein YprB with RNaseH-like and TPR domain